MIETEREMEEKLLKKAKDIYMGLNVEDRAKLENYLNDHFKLSDQDRISVESYLAGRYSFQHKLPKNHPGYKKLSWWQKIINFVKGLD